MLGTFWRLIAGALLATGAGAAGAPAAAGAQPADPWVGIWILDGFRSSYGSGPAPRSLTRTVVAVGGGYRYVSDGVSAAGAPMHQEITFPAVDGRYYPAPGSASYDSVMMRTVDARTVEAAFKKGATVVSSITIVTAADGKRQTQTTKGTGTNGLPFTDVAVYDRKP